MITPEQALEESINIIERDGWHQGSYFDGSQSTSSEKEWDEAARTAPVCALGALSRAVFGYAMIGAYPDNEDYVELSDVYFTAEKRLKDVVGRHVPHFNDDKDTTKEDVILAIKKAAHGD
jgi:hypothetical protein